ncbi:type IV toxin-antitoxin system AbiEi family antitoxin domain-containing protein [Nocardioides endophyticus]|uniref:Type IV toxin-antitoxin system AbiEi family antitoxin domain-containing protein n=1 Tax=Nocardioides endophyticus TaxID=1353775 RepID=A0ABP8YVM3_9ACTN
MNSISGIDLRHDNLFPTRELLAAGQTDKSIAAMLQADVLHRVRHGAYTYAAHWNELDEVEKRMLVAHAVLLNARAPVALAGPSAADVFGVPVWQMGEEVHLARLDGKAGRREAGRVEHRGHTVCEDLTIRNGIPVTSGTRTAVDMIALADTEHALVTVNGLLHAKETSIELIQRRLESMTYDPHTLNAPVVLGLADGRCESAGETRTFCLCRRHRLPMPIPQVEIRNGSGKVVARVDFAWPELGVFAEFDGNVKYLRLRRPGESIEQVVLREKRREELICGLTGWRCIRIIWADLHHAERTAARIRATLDGLPWAA